MNLLFFKKMTAVLLSSTSTDMSYLLNLRVGCIDVTGSADLNNFSLNFLCIQKPIEYTTTVYSV